MKIYIIFRQLNNSFIKYCKRLHISCELLIGNISNKEKNKLYENLEIGKIQIIIGTHALIQDKVKFKNLELVVVDEQHRFGVEQRKNLITKGKHVNILAMTATPIPRTLTFALHGDMELSWIDEFDSVDITRWEEATHGFYGYNCQFDPVNVICHDGK